MKKLEKLNNYVEQIRKIDEDFESNRNLLEQLSEDMEVETANLVRSSFEDMAEEEIEAFNETAKSTSKLTRRIGQGFFNLFKVTFTVSFAGVTLIHFTIPKVDKDGNVKQNR